MVSLRLGHLSNGISLRNSRRQVSTHPLESHVLPPNLQREGLIEIVSIRTRDLLNPGQSGGGHENQCVL